MIHPSTKLAFISKEKGYGVIATAFIPKGTITWVQDKLDMEFTPLEVDLLGAEYQTIIETYTFRNSLGNYILCWDNGRFVNHSFNSNCLTTPYNFEIAIRDIEVGEELTDDYGYLNISEPFEGIPEESSRTIVYPDDLVRLHEFWDEQLKESIPFVTQVNQLLMPFIANDIQDKIKRILNNEVEMDSILSCYFDPKQISVL